MRFEAPCRSSQKCEFWAHTNFGPFQLHRSMTEISLHKYACMILHVTLLIVIDWRLCVFVLLL